MGTTIAYEQRNDYPSEQYNLDGLLNAERHAISTSPAFKLGGDSSRQFEFNHCKITKSQSIRFII